MPALAHDGRALAAALMTIREIGDGPALDEAVSQAFPGAALELTSESGTVLLPPSGTGVAAPSRAI
jgi:predicted ATPase